MYKIIEIPYAAAESTEQLGTKYKFWYTDVDHGIALFKQGRPGTGENWAEKIASELANLIAMPHAQYEFARHRDLEGVITPTLVARGARLIHGNELLTTFVTDYGTDHTNLYHRREHTMGRLLGYLRASSQVVGAPYGVVWPPAISTALDCFVGYLMFDAWIANQDRHDQNWGLLRTTDGNNYLAPSYDHGSSMGRNENDAKRRTMLETKDMGQHISRYVTTARSAIFPHTTEVKPPRSLLTLDAFQQAARQSTNAANEWRRRLAGVSEGQVVYIIENVPTELMSDVAKKFTAALLKLNRQRILDCELGK